MCTEIEEKRQAELCAEMRINLHTVVRPCVLCLKARSLLWGIAFMWVAPWLLQRVCLKAWSAFWGVDFIQVAYHCYTQPQAPLVRGLSSLWDARACGVLAIPKQDTQRLLLCLHRVYACLFL
ncbi:hypothetical protein DUNSADRAFT_5691 [Dunaliella salina]|uniref:Encoded protein n=1 Tax=Dunaliella salina TaxID=3046 RepID=A0ABQ7GPW5_DUNSA|nr:hypothetical protein DUNSADRAFT_5691 [Dunaliella salina]|eukprot:KAF5836616.1 hypothetical protein DUNSADRAFT_5691 [Dunaliella salina]